MKDNYSGHHAFTSHLLYFRPHNEPVSMLCSNYNTGSESALNSVSTCEGDTSWLLCVETKCEIKFFLFSAIAKCSITRIELLLPKKGSQDNHTSAKNQICDIMSGPPKGVRCSRQSQMFYLCSSSYDIKSTQPNPLFHCQMFNFTSIIFLGHKCLWVL